jgi:hypothetical protein
MKYVLIQIINFDQTTLSKEKERLVGQDPFLIIEYIRSTIEILMNLKMEELQAKKNEEEANSTNHDTPQDYEQMLQKLEAEVRNHIRVYKFEKVEQQLKLHIESTQTKLDESENQNKVIPLLGSALTQAKTQR